MTDAFILQLFLKRDREIKELVIDTLAKACTSQAPPTLYTLSEALQTAINLQYDLEVAGLLKQVSELRQCLAEAQKNQYTAPASNAEVERRAVSAENEVQRLRDQCASNARDIDRLKRIADMVPDLIKQFEEERKKLKLQTEEKVAQARVAEACKWKSVAESIKGEVLELKDQLGRMRSGERTRERTPVKEMRLKREELKSSERKEEKSRLQYYETLIKDFQRKLRGSNG